MQHLSLKAGVVLLLFGLVACGGRSASIPATHSVPLMAAGLRSDAESSQATDAQANYTLAIDSGSQTTLGGWIADAYYSGGGTVSVTNSINRTNVSNPAPQAVYQSQRYGASFTYTIPNLTPNAQYSVVLEFVESFWNAAGKRAFNVTLNGTRVLSGFDIFATAGGANIAVTRTFATSADAGGKITLQFAAAKDNATVAGIGIVSASATATPAPAPTTTPDSSGGGDVLPWVYSELWSASSPFRTTVAQQKSRGATAVSQTYMNALWNQHVAGNGVAQGIPIYVSKSSDPLVTTTCTEYGTRCNAKNVQIHLSPYATAQQASDGHIVVIDTNAPSGSIELDCFQASMSGSHLDCSWAGVFTIGGMGLATDGSEGIHGGMAVTTVITVGQEVANGHVDHALGLNTHCLNNPTLYPADQSVGTDKACDGSANPPHYGNLMHLLWSPAQIAASAYSKPCKVILTALATYGAYLEGTGNNGLQLSVQNELSYTALPSTKSADPWPSIYSQLSAAGDGKEYSWLSCMNRLHSSDFELLQLRQP